MKRILISISLIIVMLSGCASLFIPSGYAPIQQGSVIYSKYNEFNETTIFRHKNFLPVNNLEFYCVSDTSALVGRLKVAYFGNSWIFFDNVIIKDNHNNRFEFSMKSHEKTTEVLSGSSVYEGFDAALSYEQITHLYKIMGSKEVKMRLSGKYHKDYVLSNESKINLRSIMYHYKKLHG